MKLKFSILFFAIIISISSIYGQVGVDWTAATLNANFSVRHLHTLLSYDNKMWVIGGADITYPHKKDVWWSTNGVDWMLATGNAQFEQRAAHGSVVFDNKMWVIAGEKNGSRSNDVWYSTDGITWTQATSNAAFGVRATTETLVYDNKMWVIGGFNGTMYNDVWWSTDGVNWTASTTNAPFPGRSGHSAVVYDDGAGEKMYVIAGVNYDLGTNLKDVWCSSNGVDWDQVTGNAAFGGREGTDVIVFDNKMWLIGGFASGLYTDVWWSEDGATWNLANGNALTNKGGERFALVYDDKMWVIAGGGGSFYVNDVWYSEANTPTPTETPTLTAVVTPVVAATWTIAGLSGIESNSLGYCGKDGTGKGIFYYGSWGNDSGVYRMEVSDSEINTIPVYALRDFTSFTGVPGDANTVWGTNWDGKLYKFENALSIPTVTAINYSSYATPRGTSLAIDRLDSDNMLLTSYQGVYRSENGGVTWTEADGVNYIGLQFMHVEQSPWNPDDYYVFGSVAGGGLYRYTWSTNTLVKLGLDNIYASRFAIDYSSGTVSIYALSNSGEIYHYNGSTFTQKTSLSATGNNRDILVNNRCATQEIYAGGYLLKSNISTDGCSNWSDFGSSEVGGIFDLDMDPDRDYLFAATSSGVYFKSVCAGVVATLTPVMSIPSHTVTITYTSTPTDTATPSSTSTASDTATFTRTSTPSFTATLTSTLTYTPTTTQTYTSIPTYTSTSIPSATETETSTPNDDEDDNDDVLDDGDEQDTQCYPNNLDPKKNKFLKIVFNVNKKCEIKGHVYNLKGDLVDTFDYSIGTTPNDKVYKVQLDVSRYAPGMYFYSIQAKTFDGEVINYHNRKFMIRR